MAMDVRSSFPYAQSACRGGESAALAHLEHYFSTDAAQRYKQTRNGLAGLDYSTKFSPWLATGAISPRTVYAALKAYESTRGANESTYWIWFELLWRDYFRFLHLQHGRRLYRAAGLHDAPAPPHDDARFEAWCKGRSGEVFNDAGLRELEATGYLSNRLRQNVASWLINDLRCDFRAGAAWFESQLVDYDPYSNQGNWLYLAGRGTDPREGRRFDPSRQARMYDADGAYRLLWNRPA
jgi:deoxyribodipyrimidine photo-lyase